MSDTPKDTGLAEFTEYFVTNYPGPDTIISDPRWHAPKIFRAATRQLALDLNEARAQIATLTKLVNTQAEDAGLWFVAQYASEAYLQNALRTLHAAIEADGWARKDKR